jgi:DNA-binding protein Fis
VRTSLESYFKDLADTEPAGIYDMMVRVVARCWRCDAARQQPVRAAEWRG